MGLQLTGRTAAWGHTKEQMLHCVQLAAFQIGTVVAMLRFSTLVVPGGKTPPGVNTLQSGQSTEKVKSSFVGI